jgi:hypothetical protein
MHRRSLSLIVTLIALMIASLSAAQGKLGRGTLTGTVRDASGGVLPGVTVEAASPALIEKTRASSPTRRASIASSLLVRASIP